MSAIDKSLGLTRKATANFSTRGKVCLITGELEGPFFNGGVGTTNRALATILRGLGYEVDILFTNVERGAPLCLRGKFSDHVADFHNLGIRLLSIDHSGDRTAWQARSYLAMQHLMAHRYDLAFFDDYEGSAYYPVLARATGSPNLRNTKMCVTAHSTHQWLVDVSQIPSTNLEQIRLMEMERRSIELADVLKAPSSYIIRKYRSYGWNIPENFVVLPNFVSMGHSPVSVRRQTAVTEIVFFGRIESRKGLDIFLGALDRLKFTLADRTITFLGRSSPETSAYLLKRAAAWPFSIRLLSNFNQSQAREYLKGDGRLAVMPSPEDNSPSAIIECIEEGIPFITTSGSGGEELISQEFHAANLFEPTVDALTDKLLQTLAEGGRTATASFDWNRLRLSFAEWMNGLGLGDQQPPGKVRATAKPILLIIVPAGIEPIGVAARLQQIVEAYANNVRIEVLTQDPSELRELLAYTATSSISVHSLTDFATVRRSIVAGPATILGICSISQPILPPWIDRARACFAKNAKIAAVTGMALSSVEESDIRYPSIEGQGQRREVERFLLGYAPSLFAITTETNDGFAVMRSEVFGLVDEVDPVDLPNCQLKLIEDWIHEILVALSLQGHRFELIPDEPMTPRAVDLPRHLGGAVPFLRRLGDRLSAGSSPEQSILTRLAIDDGLARRQAESAVKYREYLSIKIGSGAQSAADPEHLHLARVAYSSGQIELALDLAAANSIPHRYGDRLPLADYVRRAAKSVRLTDFLARKQYEGVNVGHKWSLRLTDDHQFELHPNTSGEGRALVAFSDVDLSELTRFVCSMALPGEGARPVRVRIDLMSPDGSLDHATEKILRDSTWTNWEFDVPADMRTASTVMLSVEMADPRHPTKNAYVRLRDPAFI